MSELIECLDGLTANQIFRRIAKTANGQPFYLQASGLGGLDFCAEYQAVYDYWEANLTVPDDAIAINQDIMVRAMVAAGTWTLRDVIYVWAGHSQVASLTNWKNPGTNDAIVVSNGGAIGWVQFEGFTSDGSAYINTNYNPSTFGGNYAQNDANMGIYVRTNTVNVDYDAGGYDGTANVRICPRFTGGTERCYGLLNTTGNSFFTVTDSLGYYTINRTAVNDQDIRKNKAVGVNDVDASTGVPNVNLYACAWNNNGTPDTTNRQQSLLALGGGMTIVEQDDETDAIEAYMDSNGKGVIP